MNNEITIIITGEDGEQEEKTVTQEEFEVIKQILKNPSPEEISNCCGADVYEHNANDNTSRCTQCQEGCEVIYII